MTIFEDDAIACYEFEACSAELMSGLPTDWDFMKWGWEFNPYFAWVDLGFMKAKLEFYDRQFSGADGAKFQSTKFTYSTFRMAHSFGNHAYSVSPKGARALLDYCLPLGRRLVAFPGARVVVDSVGIDTLMCGVYPSMRAFMCCSPMVLQDVGLPSDRLQADCA